MNFGGDPESYVGGVVVGDQMDQKAVAPAVGVDAVRENDQRDVVGLFGDPKIAVKGDLACLVEDLVLGNDVESEKAPVPEACEMGEGQEIVPLEGGHHGDSPGVLD